MANLEQVKNSGSLVICVVYNVNYINGLQDFATLKRNQSGNELVDLP
jgi:hypothetical protein